MNSFEFIAPIGVLAIIFGSIITIIRIATDARLKHRLLNKGVDAELVKSLLTNRQDSNTSALKWGLVMIGVGVALAIGTIVGHDEITAALMLVFGGIGFVLFFLVSQGMKNNDNSGFKF